MSSEGFVAVALNVADVFCHQKLKLHLLGGWAEPGLKQPMVIVDRPLRIRVVGPLPKWHFVWLINKGDPITIYDTWDDPPSTSREEL